MIPIDKGFWRYGLFQIPAIILGTCLLIAAIVSVITLPCALFWRLLVWSLAAISLAWTLVLPLDHLLKLQTQLPMNLRGQIALGNTLFWSALILSLMFSRLPPLWTICSAGLPTNNSEQVSLDWSQWHANIWDEMFYNNSYPSSIPVGAKADFSFTVTQGKSVRNIEIESDEPSLDKYVSELILALDGSEALEFVPTSKRLFEKFTGLALVTSNTQIESRIDKGFSFYAENIRSLFRLGSPLFKQPLSALTWIMKAA